MIVLKVKDAESDDGLKMPQWMNNAHDIESDGSDVSSDANSETSSDSSSETLSDDSADENEEARDDEDEGDIDDLSDNATSSLTDDTGEEIDGFDLFPAYHLPDNMDTSDDEETAMARGSWYWYLYDKGYVSFPSPTERDSNSEDKVGEIESTSGTNEISKTADDSSSKICDPSTTDKFDTTPDETRAEKSTPLDA